VSLGGLAHGYDVSSFLVPKLVATGLVVVRPLVPVDSPVAIRYYDLHWVILRSILEMVSDRSDVAYGLADSQSALLEPLIPPDLLGVDAVFSLGWGVAV
jgi:hypothetical protein